MDIDRILNGAASFGCQIFIYGSLSFCAGHAYAMLSGSKSAVTAKIFTIASLIFLAFREAVDFHITRYEERNLVYIFGVCFGGLALTQMLKQAEVISQLTASVLVAAVAILTAFGLGMHFRQTHIYT